jgi:tryptophan halogenase
MIKRVIVLGGGSAGLIAALTLKIKFPQLDLVVIRSGELGIIGVGEGTTPMVPTHLHGYLNIDPGEFLRETQPSWKLGIRFLWGPRPHFDYTFTRQIDWKWDALPKSNGYYCGDDFTCADVASALMALDKVFARTKNGDPFIGRDFGYHIENEPFVVYLEKLAARHGIPLDDDLVNEVKTGPAGVEALLLKSGRVVNADLFIDCSGFRSVLLGQALAEPYIDFRSTLFCDRAVAGGWDRTTEPIKPYTTAETMDAGWCWQIEHPTRVIRGYVYSSAFISEEDAEREFRSKNSKLTKTRLLKFPSGRYRNSWVKNVVAVGNAAGFVEPLEATSLHVICHECHILAGCLGDSEFRPGPLMIEAYNRLLTRPWDEIRWFLGVHYKFNTRLDTPFWRACRADVNLGPAEAIVSYYRECGPACVGRDAVLHPLDIFGLEGYFCMLIGQRVPYEHPYTPSAQEWEHWNILRSQLQARAAAGLSVQEAYAKVSSPTWQWNPGYFAYSGPPLFNTRNA